MEIIAKVDVLGAEYTIIQETKEQRAKVSKNRDYDGYCDTTSKNIYINEISEENGYVWEDLIAHRNRAIRHELIHAFLFESGLDVSSEWAENEELVDWIAIQFPKISEMFESLGTLRSDNVDTETNYFVITDKEGKVLAVIDLEAQEVIESEEAVVYEMSTEEAEADIFSEDEEGNIYLDLEEIHN